MLKAIVIFMALSVLTVRSQTPSCTANCTVRPVLATNMCLQFADGSLLNGVTLELVSCNGSPEQHWNLTFQGRNTYTSYQFVNVKSGKCIDITDSSFSDGAVAEQGDCNSNAVGQVFQAVTKGSGFLLQPNTGATLFDSNKCLDVTDSNTVNGTRIQQWDCVGGPNQQFVISF